MPDSAVRSVDNPAGCTASDGAGPQRAHVFQCKIEGDTLEAVIGELRFFQQRLARGEISAGVMGGCTAGAIYAYRVNPDVTHESYFRDLDAWLEAEKTREAGADPYTQTR